MENQYNIFSITIKRALPLIYIPPKKTLGISFQIELIFKSAISRNSPSRLSVDRSVDRPQPTVDRASRPCLTNRELGTFSRSTGRSTALLLRSTGRVDRYAPCMFVHDGRPDRSTVLLLLPTVDRPPAVAADSLCCCADSFGRDDIVDFLDFLSLPTILLQSHCEYQTNWYKDKVKRQACRL